MNLDEIRARADKATEGPWFATTPNDDSTEWFDDYDYPMVVTSDSAPGNYAAIAREICQGETAGQADAEFIAHAREDIPALLAEIDRLNSALGACQSALRMHLNVCDDGEES